MKVDLDKYKIVSKIFLGTNLKFVFQNLYDTTDKKVLELKKVVGFIDNNLYGKSSQLLAIVKQATKLNKELIWSDALQEYNLI